MSMLSPDSLPRLQRALAAAGLDGWLLFDFHGVNPVAAGALGLEGMVTRRVFAYVPREGVPTAVTHAIEQGPWRRWPAGWRRERYSSWRTLESSLGALVGGKRVAMEYSPGDAVPYLDRVPAGVIEMVRAAGATVVSSADLVTQFYAVWSAEHLAVHRRVAEAVAAIGRAAIARAGDEARAGRPADEYTLQQWIMARFAEQGLNTPEPPIVAAGANAADPHYAPPVAGSARIERGSVLLVDLWAREGETPFADQTWMGVLGEPSERAEVVWSTIRDARDAALALLRERVTAGKPVRGGEVDDAARRVVEARGFGEYFIHRTGHSIDPHDLHGSGPHIDNLETREERLLVPGVGFSIEPGIYLPGEFGVRIEDIVTVTEDGAARLNRATRDLEVVR
jgi:Xaa-Pro dipeptidase